MRHGFIPVSGAPLDAANAPGVGSHDRCRATVRSTTMRRFTLEHQASSGAPSPPGAACGPTPRASRTRSASCRAGLGAHHSLVEARRAGLRVPGWALPGSSVARSRPAAGSGARRLPAPASPASARWVAAFLPGPAWRPRSRSRAQGLRNQVGTNAAQAIRQIRRDLSRQVQSHVGKRHFGQPGDSRGRPSTPCPSSCCSRVSRLWMSSRRSACR